MEPEVLKLQNVSVGYSSQNILISDINLSLNKGELIALIGRNGSGKSTFLRTIVRLQKALNGYIILEGKKINDIDPNEFAHKIAFVSSGVEFSETLTVFELVSLGRFPYTNWLGHMTDFDISIVNESLELIGISGLKHKKISEISDGERQKAMIARTFAQNTSVIVLDEPTAFLDLPSKYDIIGLLYELTRKGKTVIYSTHDLNLALTFSDKISIINNSELQYGTPEDLILNNKFSEIFETDKVTLNAFTGNFEFKKEFKTQVSVICKEQLLAYWTQQALLREAIQVTDFKEGIPVIHISRQQEIISWTLSSGNITKIYNSIDQLLNGLNQIL